MNDAQFAFDRQRELLDQVMGMPLRLEKVLANIEAQGRQLGQEETSIGDRLAAAETRRNEDLRRLDEQVASIRAEISPKVTALQNDFMVCEQQLTQIRRQLEAASHDAKREVQSAQKAFEARLQKNVVQFEKIPTLILRGIHAYLKRLRNLTFFRFCLVYPVFLIFPTPLLDLAAPLLPSGAYGTMAELGSILTTGCWSYVLGRPILMVLQFGILLLGLLLLGCCWFCLSKPLMGLALAMSNGNQRRIYEGECAALQKDQEAIREALALRQSELEKQKIQLDNLKASAALDHQRRQEDALADLIARQEPEKASALKAFEDSRAALSTEFARAKAKFKAFKDQQLEAWAGAEASRLLVLEAVGKEVLEMAPGKSVHGSGLILIGWQSLSIPRLDSQASRLKTLGKGAILEPFCGLETLVFWPMEDLPSLVVDANSGEEAKPILNSILIQILEKTDAGSSRFLFVDPRKLGGNVTPFLNLGDEHRNLIFTKACSDPRDIEERLVEVFEHVEEIIQQKIGHQFKNLDAYNRKAPVPEPHIYLVVYDYPFNWTEEARKRLATLINLGHQAGVHLLLVRSSEDPGDTLWPKTENLAHIQFLGRERWAYGKGVPFRQARVVTEAEISDRVARVRQELKAAANVSIPFERVAPAPEALWLRTGIENLTVALGPRNATELQHLVLEDERPHALLAGATGSGKSNTLHVIITNLAANHSPENLRFYLLDFKAGTEFKGYTSGALPHAEVISISSEREFGLAVIRDLKEEFEGRLNTFKQNEVTDLIAFRKKFPEAVMPRILVVMDEFQVLFNSDDSLAKEAGCLISDLARRARAAGIHLLLSTQSLHAGAMGMYGLDGSALGQFAVRIAMRCDPDSSRKILDAENDEAAFLIRKGEAIYNPSSGLRSSNQRFQVAMLPMETRERYLRVMASKAKVLELKAGRQMVFDDEGQPEAQAGLCQTVLEAEAKEYRTVQLPCVLGKPVTTKPLLLLNLERQNGMNLAILGRSETMGASILGSALNSLTWYLERQWGLDPDGSAPITFINLTVPGSPSDAIYQNLEGRNTGAIRVVTDGLEVPLCVDAYYQILLRRKAAGGAPLAGSVTPPAILALHGLQSMQGLNGDNDRYLGTLSGSEGPSLTMKLQEILKDGPPLGLHTLVWCNTIGNLSGRLGREGSQEFTCRVALHMEEFESNEAISNPQASQLGGMAALLKQPGESRLSKFRPFRAPAKVGC